MPLLHELSYFRSGGCLSSREPTLKSPSIFVIENVKLHTVHQYTFHFLCILMIPNIQFTIQYLHACKNEILTSKCTLQTYHCQFEFRRQLPPKKNNQFFSLPGVKCLRNAGWLRISTALRKFWSYLLKMSTFSIFVFPLSEFVVIYRWFIQIDQRLIFSNVKLPSRMFHTLINTSYYIYLHNYHKIQVIVKVSK